MSFLPFLSWSLYIVRNMQNQIGDALILHKGFLVLFECIIQTSFFRFDQLIARLHGEI